MTPQERAANLYRSLTCTTYREIYQDPENDIAIIAQAFKTARQEALIDVMRLHKEWRAGKHSGLFSDLLARLASEGGG